MGDLISRQAVIDLLKKNLSKDIEEVIVTDKNIKLIESMPCAYDFDVMDKNIKIKKCYYIEITDINGCTVWEEFCFGSIEEAEKRAEELKNSYNERPNYDDCLHGA